MKAERQYWVMSREGIELTCLNTFDDRNEAWDYMRTLEPGLYSLASFIALDAKVRPPERNRPAQIIEGGIRFYKRSRVGSTEKGNK
jgi:hypothetical protein